MNLGFTIWAVFDGFKAGNIRREGGRIFGLGGDILVVGCPKRGFIPFLCSMDAWPGEPFARKWVGSIDLLVVLLDEALSAASLGTSCSARGVRG